MIVCNLWLPSGNDFGEGEYDLTIAAIVNDEFALRVDEEKLIDCLENHEFDEPIKHETLYELSFDRATIASDPLPEPAFSLTSIRERKTSPEGQFLDLIRL